MSLLVLFESSAGYALLDVVEAEEAGSMLPEVGEEGKSAFGRALFCSVGEKRKNLA